MSHLLARAYDIAAKVHGITVRTTAPTCNNGTIDALAYFIELIENNYQVLMQSNIAYSKCCNHYMNMEPNIAPPFQYPIIITIEIRMTVMIFISKLYAITLLFEPLSHSLGSNVQTLNISTLKQASSMWTAVPPMLPRASALRPLLPRVHRTSLSLG